MPPSKHHSVGNKCLEQQKEECVDDDDDESFKEDNDDVVGSEDSSAKSETADAADEQVQLIAQDETQVVRCLKFAVAFVLICSALGVALWTYRHVAGSETFQFQANFADDADKIFDSIGTSFRQTLGVFDTLSVTLIAFARATDAQWPYVTLPFFAVRTAKLLALSNSMYISVSPIVMAQQRIEWEAYQEENNGWVNETIAALEQWNDHDWYLASDWKTTPQYMAMMVSFHTMKPTGRAVYNFDRLSTADAATPRKCLETHQAVLGAAYMIPAPDDPAKQAEADAWETWFEKYLPSTDDAREPASDIYYPLIDDLSQIELADGEVEYDPNEHRVVGVIGAIMRWREYLKNILPEDSNGIDVVFRNPCTLAFTYRIYGPEPKYLGVGDLHDKRYDFMEKVAQLADLGQDSSEVYTGVPMNIERCPFTISLYPSSEMEAYHTTSNRVTFTVIAVLIFGFTTLVFCLYDTTVERRQKIVMHTAIRSSAIVSSLFPEDVRERIYGSEDQDQANVKGSLLSYGSKSKDKVGLFAGDPIAELYPETTVLFADIAGFTAWSSERHAVQVFCLLETVYHAFDVIAKHRGVFKVETIGDSYVAVVGLPTPRYQHAVVMARFARDIRNKMVETVLELEKSLGPGTANLALRIGLNSGPTTAGVLRGEKSRFQLFGDTFNTAARMGSNGLRNKIQVTQKTADLLIVAGKGHWVTPRLDKVNAKGKGMMQTFWCEPRVGGDSRAESSQSGGERESREFKEANVTEKDRTARLVDWHVDLLLGVLQNKKNHNVDGMKQPAFVLADTDSTKMPRDEVADLIVPENLTSGTSEKTETVEITPLVKEQLRELVERIAQKYTTTNAFHTFAHCSHVVLSAKKLLDNLVVAEDAITSTRHSFVMAKHPLTQFAILFAALIHDVDHPGVSNAQQVQEQTVAAVRFAGQSVAEQHSFTMAWSMLMEPQYIDLHKVLFSNKDDLELFRQVVVNAVMATDLFDANLKQVREERWQLSRWSDPATTDKNNDDDASLASSRASCLVDFIVQLSDVAHTMQHFTIYKKWNLRLFDEMSTSYYNGRAGDRNPAVTWYDGEIAFLDNYVVMFGVLGDEFLAYVQDNRVEWQAKGRDIVLQAFTSHTKKDDGLIEV